VLIAVLWTLFMLAVTVVLALEAIVSLNNAEQRCFFNYPAIPCPGGDDPAVVRLTVAFIGVPLAWLVGLGFLGLARWVMRRNGSGGPEGIG
jgi:hypothetical protein